MRKNISTHTPSEERIGYSRARNQLTMSKQTRREAILRQMLLLIRENPGIRPRELHKRLNIEHSAGLRNTLINMKLVRKERKGTAVYYYPLQKGQ